MDRTLEDSLARSRAMLAEAQEEAEQVVAECQAQDAHYREQAQAGAQEMFARIEAAQQRPESQPAPTAAHEPAELKLYDTADEPPATPPAASRGPRQQAAPRRGQQEEDEDFSEIDWMNG